MTNEEVFGFARRFISPLLIDDSGWDRLREQVGGLPAAAVQSGMAGFEFRLGEAEPTADLGVFLTAPGALVDYYVERGRRAPAGSREATMGAFLSQMSREAWPASCIVEYDVWGVPAGERRDPGLFVNVGPIAQNAGMPAPAEVVDIVSDALCLPRRGDEREAMENGYAALPRRAFVNMVGAMPSREVRAVRMWAEKIDAPDVPGFLDRLGWPGPVPLVEETLAELLRVAPRFMLALDLTPDGPLPYVSIGMSPFDQGVRAFDGWETGVRDDWRPLIEHLVAKGLCRRDKGDALLALQGRSGTIGPAGARVVYQAIVGPKITVSDDGLSLKGYSVVRHGVAGWGSGPSRLRARGPLGSAGAGCS